MDEPQELVNALIRQRDTYANEAAQLAAKLNVLQAVYIRDIGVLKEANEKLSTQVAELTPKEE
jgi:hypothetical protein